MNAKFEYFIAYSFAQGTGSQIVGLPQAITSGDTLMALQQDIGNRRGYNVLITNFQLLSGPDTCTTCGNHRAE